jgi:hypothetical protein
MKPTKTEAIRVIATQDGHHHSNAHFIERVWEVFGLEVGSDHVCHAVGSRKSRIKFVPREAKSLAMQLMSSCSFDRALVRQALDSVG